MTEQKIFKKITFLMILAIILLIDFEQFNFDAYFLIKTGEYIVNNGFPHTDFFSMHNMPIVLQNWLSSIIFYGFYNIFGFAGMIIYVMLFLLIIMFIMYKICYLINGHKINAIIFTFLYLISSIPAFESRPQMISIICILSSIYFLEKYTKTNAIKYLIPIPFICVLQINVHATMYIYIFAVIFVYLFNFKLFTSKVIINDNNYNKIPIIITAIISFVCLFINPYGYKNVLYLFKSAHSDLSLISMEIQEASISNYGGITLLLFIAILCIIFYNVKNKIHLSHLLLLIGAIAITLFCIKNVSMLAIAYIIFLCSYFKENLNYKILIEKVFGNLNILFVFILILLIGYRLINIDNYILKPGKIVETATNVNEIADYLEENTNTNEITCYSNIAIGNYLQFYDIKTFIDCRNELFLKQQNGQNDYLTEYILVELGSIDIEEFTNKYNFDYIIVTSEQVFLDDVKKSPMFEKVFVNSTNNLAIYKVVDN